MSALVDRELAGVRDASRVVLAGFSEGAQLASYVQLAHLDYALGGVAVLDGYPLPPLCHMPGADPAAARANATYVGGDMSWMIWWGESDTIFPVDASMAAYRGIFAALGIEDALKVEHTEPGQPHDLTEAEIARLMSFVRAN